jgi:hypothetical protein
MKFGILGGFGMAVLLAGCQSAGPPENQAGNIAEPPAGGVLAAAKPGTRDWLVGTWVQQGAVCAPLDLLDTGFYRFEAGGTYLAFEGGEGSWDLAGDQLALDYRDNDAVISNENSPEALRNAQTALVHETHRLSALTPDGFTLGGTAFHRCPEQPGSRAE